MSVFNICIELFNWRFVFVLLFFNRLCVSVYIGPKLNVNPKCSFLWRTYGTDWLNYCVFVGCSKRHERAHEISFAFVVCSVRHERALRRLKHTSGASAATKNVTSKDNAAVHDFTSFLST